MPPYQLERHRNQRLDQLGRPPKLLCSPVINILNYSCQCAGQFHVGLEHEDEDEDLHGEDSDPRIGDKGDEERGRA